MVERIIIMKYTYVTDYKNNDKLRKSFNELTEKTFCFNFVEWYTNGFWSEKYIPYSLADCNKIIANVSVNLMDFHMDGIKKHYIQIGTVMTDRDYRGQGLSRFLMEKIIDEYKDKTDGIYLFGNDSVINFYPKFGFVESKEYQYSKTIYSANNENTIQHVNMDDKANWSKLLDAVKCSMVNDRLVMDNPELFAFWTTGCLRNNVYYLAEEDIYIIADVKEDNLFIYQTVANHKINLEKIVSSFGCGIKEVTLGFTPYESNGYSVEELHEEDCTLFILGKDLEHIEKKKLMFPVLSHA